MSRFQEWEPYDDGLDALRIGRWEHNLRQIIKGRKGQKILRDLEAALVAWPDKRLIEGSICEPKQPVVYDENGEAHPVDYGTVTQYEACAIGVFALSKGKQPQELIDWLTRDEDGDFIEVSEAAEETAYLGESVGMQRRLAWEIAELNDEWASAMTPEKRYEYVLATVRRWRTAGVSA